jgi:hypothetical protein
MVVGFRFAALPVRQGGHASIAGSSATASAILPPPAPATSAPLSRPPGTAVGPVARHAPASERAARAA